MSNKVADSYADVGMLLNVILTNVMTSLVYRQLKLGRFSDSPSLLPTVAGPGATSTVRFRARIRDPAFALGVGVPGASTSSDGQEVDVEYKCNEEQRSVSAESLAEGDNGYGTESMESILPIM